MKIVIEELKEGYEVKVYFSLFKTEKYGCESVEKVKEIIDNVL